MTAPVKLVGFAVLLVLVFAASVGVGRLAAPDDRPADRPPAVDHGEHDDG